jgi:hypothetical protein
LISWNGNEKYQVSLKKYRKPVFGKIQASCIFSNLNILNPVKNYGGNIE